MKTLARDDPGDFHRAAPNVRVGEQHLAKWTATQLGQSAAPTPQGGGGNQRSGKHPGLVATQQLYFTGPGQGVQP